MHFLDGALFPENQEKLVITAAPYGPEWLPSRFSRGHRGLHEGPGAEGGRLLQRRRHRAARARARRRRQGLEAPVEVQRAAGPAARRGARHDPAGRRLDLLRAGDRRREGEVAVRRHPPHAGRAQAEAGPGDGHGQHHADERRRADGTRRHRRHVAGRARDVQRLSRDDRARRPGLGRGARAAPDRRRHPERVPVLQHQQLRDGRAHDPARRLQGPADDELGRDRRRHGRAESSTTSPTSCAPRRTAPC